MNMGVLHGHAAARLALFLPSLDGGGAEQVFVELANEFAGRGHRVDLVLGKARGPYLDDVAASVRVVDLGATRVFRALPKLFRYLRDERPAAILSGLDHSNVVAILACHLNGKATRCVISIRSVPSAVYRESHSRRGQRVLWFARLAYRFADAIIANSRAGAEDVSRLLGRPIGAIHVVHNPLNLGRIEALSREAQPHPWLAHPEMPVVIGVGSLTRLKDFGTLVRAFAILRRRLECRLVILGEGPLRGELEALAQQEGVGRDVLMPGFVKNPFPWIRSSRVFVSSSLTEGCPNALMQALALGTPIVGTECAGGSAEVLEGGRWGRLVPVGEPAAMADAIEACFTEPANAGARSRAAEFSHQRVASRFLEVLLPQGHPV